MSLVLVEGSLYFEQPLSELDGLRLIKRTVKSLGSYRGAPFQPYLPRQAVLLDNEDPVAFEASGYGITFNHEPLAREMNSSAFFLNLIYLNSDQDVKQIRIYPYKATYGADLARVWKVLLDIMPRSVESTRADLAFATGTPEEDEGEALPPAREIIPKQLPPFLTPWTYIGPNHLTAESRPFLRELPAKESQPFFDGWIIRAADNLLERPSPEFLEKLRSAPNPVPLSYRQPEIVDK